MSAEVVARVRDLVQVEALVALAQERYREQLRAWMAGDREEPPPVPDDYRHALSRLQVALGRLSLAMEPVEPGT